MSRVLNVTLMLMASTAFARPWGGLDPGVASALDVIGTFGEPTKRATAKGKDVLVYSGDRAIKGTIQVQFKVDPAKQIVDRIDVYPEVEIPTAKIVELYGDACEAKSAVDESCYYKRETSTKHTYFLYLKLGLAIFFKDDNATVRSLAFLPAGASVTP
jgi:hypothetical protein